MEALKVLIRNGIYGDTPRYLRMPEIPPMSSKVCAPFSLWNRWKWFAFGSLDSAATFAFHLRQASLTLRPVH